MYLLMNTVNFAKKGIIDFFKNQDMNDDHVLNLLDFQAINMRSWNPEQKSALEPAIVELMREGLLKKEEGYIVLSGEGFRKIYCGLPEMA